MAKTVISLLPEVMDLVILNLHDLHDLKALALSCRDILGYCLGVSSSNLLKLYVNTYPRPYELLLASVKAQQMGEWDVKDLGLIQSVLSADEQSASGESVDKPNTTKLWHTLLKLLPLKLADLVAVRIFYLKFIPTGPLAAYLAPFLGTPVNEDNSEDEQERFDIALKTALYAFESFCQLFHRDLSPYNTVLQITTRTTAEIELFDNLRFRFLQRIFPRCIGRSRAYSRSHSMLVGIPEKVVATTEVMIRNSPYPAASTARREMVAVYATYKGLRYHQDWIMNPGSPSLIKFSNDVCNSDDVSFSHWWARVQELRRRLHQGSTR